MSGELDRYKDKVRRQCEEIASLKNKIKEQEEGLMQTSALLDGILAVIADTYGEGGRIKLSCERIRGALTGYSVSTARDGEDYVITACEVKADDGGQAC